MDNNNSFKTLMWVILGLAIVVIVIVVLTKNKKSDLDDQNVVIGSAVVEEIDVMKLESFPIQVNVLARGYTPDGCTTLGDIKQSYANNKFTIKIESKKPLDAENCTQVIMPFEKTISLNGVSGLPKGSYTVDVNGVTGGFMLEMDNFISETDPLK